VKSSARIVNFTNEMLNDSRYFLEQAKELDPSHENDWLRWRYLRASIIFSLGSFEAFVNVFIITCLKNLELVEDANDYPNQRISWETKIDKLIPYLTGQKINKGTVTWADFKLARTIRSRLMHYCNNSIDIYQDDNPLGVNIKNAEKTINAVRGMMGIINGLIGEPCPSWVNEARSRTIR